MGPSKEYYMRLQQLQSQFLQKYTGPFQSNQGGRSQVLPQRQNNLWFRTRKHQLQVNQKYRRIPPFQNFQKMRKQNPRHNIPRSHAPQIRNIPKPQPYQNIQRRLPLTQGTPKVRKQFPQTLMNQNIQRQLSQAQVNQKFQGRVPQTQINQKFQGRVPQTLINQKVQRRVPQSQVNRKFQGQFPQAQVNRKFQGQFPQNQVYQKFQGRVLQAQVNQKGTIPNNQPFRGIPNPNRPRNMRQRTSQIPINIFTPQELLQLAPGNDKKLWEWIISRLPANYTIPDAKFIHLYQAFNKQKR